MTDDYSGATDAELAVACSRRPPVTNAWNALLQRYRSIVESKIRRMWATLPRAEVEELRQEAFLKIFCYLPKSDPGHAPVEALVLRITASVVIDYWRHWKREHEVTVGIETHPRAYDAAVEVPIPDAIVEAIGRKEADSFEDPLHRRIAYMALDQISGPKTRRQLGVTLDLIYKIRRTLHQRIHDSLEQHRAAHGLKK